MIATVTLLVYLNGVIVDETEVRGAGAWNVCQAIKKTINDAKTGFVAYCSTG